ncbi:MAG: hypothetical protein ACRDZN_05215, partial [Acidimicrobiales bacterium]
MPGSVARQTAEHVERADRQVDPHAGALGRLGEQREVAQHEGGLGQDRERVGPFCQHLDDAPGQPVLALGTLVGVGVGAHGDELAGPSPRVEVVAQGRHGVDLDHDLPLEVAIGVEVEVRVGRPGEAVNTRMAAAPIRVDGVSKAERGALH